MRKRILIGVGIVAVLGLWYAFRPELLFIDQRVAEALPADGKADGNVVAMGEFHGVAHAGKGKAAIHQPTGGKPFVRFTDFETSNGPALRVYLTSAPDATDNATVQQAKRVDLGPLKGNIGEQNYEVPADVKLDDYHSVTVWCQRFSVNFATAPLHRGG